MSRIVVPVVASIVLFAITSPAATKTTKKKVTTKKPATTQAAATTTAPTASVATTVGPQSDLEKLIAAAKKEGSLLMYAANTEDKNTLVAQSFEKQYGIKVAHPPRQSGSGFTDRYQAERKAGGSPVDVFMNTGDAVFADLNNKGLLKTFDATTVPALKTYPKEYFNSYSVVPSVAAFTVCFNTNQVKLSDLSRWPDVLLPRGNVKVVIPSMNPDAYWPTWDAIRKDQGIDFLKQVGDRRPIFVPTAPGGMQLLTSGEAGILFPCAPALLGTLKAQGAPLNSKDIYPVSGLEWGIAIAQSAPHPNAALLFMNWIATLDGQVPMNSGFAGASPLMPDGIEAKGVFPMPEAKGYIKPNPGAVQNYKEITDALGFRG